MAIATINPATRDTEGLRAVWRHGAGTPGSSCRQGVRSYRLDVVRRRSAFCAAWPTCSKPIRLFSQRR